MALFDDMLPDARAGLPGAPDVLILNALRRSAAELCRQSQVWKTTLPVFLAVPGKQVYTLNPPSGSRVTAILQAWYNGVHIDVSREQDVMAQDITTGTPTRVALSMSAQSIYSFPTPAAVDNKQFQLYVALAPLPSATTLPDDIAIEFRPGIVAGAKGELMTVSPGMPYHNPNEGMLQKDIQHAWIVRAKQRHQGGGVNLGAQPRKFA